MLGSSTFWSRITIAAGAVLAAGLGLMLASAADDGRGTYRLGSALALAASALLMLCGLRLADSAREQARQQGYDDGFADGRQVVRMLPVRSPNSTSLLPVSSSPQQLAEQGDLTGRAERI